VPSDIRYTQRDRVGLVTFQRPEALNAFRHRTVSELLEILRGTATGDVRVLVLTGAGRAFSAGIDLKEMADEWEGRDLDARRQDLEQLQEVTRRIVSHPAVVIAAINGIALGIGAELAIAADLRIAADSATLGFPEVKRGLFHTNGTMYLLPRLVGTARATDWLLTGNPVAAPELLSAGVVSRLVPPDEVQAAALRWADEIAAGAPQSLRLAKQLLRRSHELDLEAVLREEVAGVLECFQRADVLEGLKAFREKRPPRYTGR
jgi:enoyl-CoA hydratase/carnithine racemase